jgi:hypothetical protein
MFSLFLVLIVLVMMHQALDFFLGHLKSGGSLRRKGVLVGTGWVPPIEWRI